MDGQVPEDVKQVETTTDAPSSTTETPVSSDQTAQESAPAASPAVPYERFKEVNDELKTIRQEIQSLRQPVEQKAPQDPMVTQAKEQLKNLLKEVAPELGYVSKQELVQIEQDRQLNSTLEKLEGAYNGKDGRPKFDRKAVVDFALQRGIADPEAAYKLLHESELMNWHVKQALSKSGGIQSEGSDGSGSTGPGPTDADLRAAAARGDDRAVKLLIRRSTASFFKK